MKITWNTDVDAPGCPGEIMADDGRSYLVQSDWDYPGVASTFGWSIRDVQNPNRVLATGETCDHGSTDGTVDCKECGCTASRFIGSAGEWLRENDGAETEDPGYFSEK